MKLTQIATLLNNTLVPNVFGGDTGTTIAEDLSNVVDLGTALANIDGDTLKNYAKTLVAGVFDTFVDTRAYKNETYGIFLDEITFGGAVQRVKAKLASAKDSAALNLVSAADSGPDYTDGHFYGTDWDSRIYDKDVAFKIPFSIGEEMLRKSFTSAAGVQKLIAMIEANIDTTLKVELNTLARGVLRKLILDAKQGSREIQLITLYNTKYNYTSENVGYVDLTNWAQDENFKIFCQTVILELRKYITDINSKYNNGDVYTFTPEEDSRCILLTEFAAEMDVALSSVYHKELVDGLGDYQTINYWQNASTALLPQISSSSVHDEVKEITTPASGENPAVVTTVSNVVGVIFDRYSAFITDRLDTVSAKYVPEELFYTYFHHVSKRYCIDPRNTSIVLTLA